MKITQSEINKLHVLIATIVVTVAESKSTPLQGTPNGHLYAALMGEMDFQLYTGVIGLLKEQGILTESYNLLKTTPKGDEMAVKLKDILNLG